MFSACLSACLSTLALCVNYDKSSPLYLTEPNDKVWTLYISKLTSHVVMLCTNTSPHHTTHTGQTIFHLSAPPVLFFLPLKENALIVWILKSFCEAQLKRWYLFILGFRQCSLQNVSDDISLGRHRWKLQFLHRLQSSFSNLRPSYLLCCISNEVPFPPHFTSFHCLDISQVSSRSLF